VSAALLCAACSSGPGPAVDGGVLDAGDSGTVDAGSDAGSDAGYSCEFIDGGVPDRFIYEGLDAGGAVALEDFVAAFSTAYCDGWRRCAPFGTSLTRACIAGLQSDAGSWTVTNCGVQVGALTCGSRRSFAGAELGAYVAAAQAGLLAFHPAKAAECVAAPWVDCPPRSSALPFNLPSVPKACLEAFTAAVDAGDACTLGNECVNSACDRLPGSCAGTCSARDAGVARTKLGGDCSAGALCDPRLGLPADAGIVDAGVLVCDGVTCRNAAGDAGMPCGDMADCAPGLYCALAGSPFGSCAPQVPLGAACTNDENAAGHGGRQCQGAALCAGLGFANGTVHAGTCTLAADFAGPCTPPLTDGSGLTTVISGCAVGYSCSCGSCVAPPASGACSPGPTQCDPLQAWCDFEGSGCQPKVVQGACTNDSACVSGACEASVCVTPVSGSCF
jgi:hypothetical protein